MQAIAPSRQVETGERVHEAGSQPTKAAVAQGRVALLFVQVFEVVAEFADMHRGLGNDACMRWLREDACAKCHTNTQREKHGELEMLLTASVRFASMPRLHTALRSRRPTRNSSDR